MQKTLLFIITLLSGFLSFTRCKKQPECICRTYEECKEDKCVLKPNTFVIGGKAITSSKVYHGVLNNYCLDTILFTVNENASSPLHPFGLYANVPPVMNVSPITTKLSDTDYVLRTSTPICYYHATGRYATIECKLQEDSVWLNFRFWTLYNKPGEFVDSCKVTLARVR